MSSQNENKINFIYSSTTHPKITLRNAHFNNPRDKPQTMFPESLKETFNKYAFIRKWIEEKALENGEGISV